MFHLVDVEASIIIVAYNSAGVLEKCLRSVVQHLDISAEVIVVDNASVDSSSDVAQRTLPTVKLIELENNVGFGNGCNAGAAVAVGRHLVFLNPDTAVEPGWLSVLTRALDDDETLGAVTPKILLMDAPDKINACGNDVHFTGFPSCHLLEVESAGVQQPASVTSISGAAFAMRRSTFEHIGGFDPEFFLYLEDNDLSWRLWLMGYQCKYMPASVVYHIYSVKVSADKFFYLEYNRHQLLLKNLKTRTLLALSPALFLAELNTWGYAVLRGPGYLVAKFRAVTQAAADWQKWRQAHTTRAKLHRQPDSALLQVCTVNIDYGSVSQGILGRIAASVFNPVYGLLHRFALWTLPAH
jgi:GT2 family glycosyltransferase